jgi:hypothetical protein
MKELDRLQTWYQAQCDGEWEHDYGVKIETLDNPGWALKVNISGTSLSGRIFSSVERGIDPDESDWIHCKTDAGFFLGYGGSQNLGELIRIFLDWAEV